MESKKVLIVEDDNSLRDVLAEFLEADGFSVVVAADGEEGINLIRETKPDIILLDVVLPKKDGYQVIKEIKSDDDVKNIPIILLTNLGSLSDIEKALELGVTNYLVKSDYQIKEIVAKIKEILSV